VPASPRIVLIDSGVDRHAAHVRAGAVTAGPSFADDGACDPAGGGDDRLGHGTAVAAAILAQCACAELIAVRVFDDTPTCAFDRVLHALHWAIAQRPHFVNLSLGTAAERFATPLRALVAAAQRQRIRIVAPAVREGMPVWPGMLEGVDGVVPDPNVPARWPEQRVVKGRTYWFAAPYAGPMLRVSAAVAGASLATANVTAFLAQGRAQG
jgi:hypothetical protein